MGFVLFSMKQLCILDNVTSLWRLNVKIFYFILQVLSVWSLFKALLFTSSVSGSSNGIRDKRDKRKRPYSSVCTTGKCFDDENVMNLTEKIKFMNCVYQDDTGNFCLQCRSWSNF